MRPHSIKTVLAVLKIISSVELPFLDLNIAKKTKSIVLFMPNSSKQKSDLWKFLLGQLSDNSNNTICWNLKDVLQFAF